MLVACIDMAGEGTLVSVTELPAQIEHSDLIEPLGAHGYESPVVILDGLSSELSERLTRRFPSFRWSNGVLKVRKQ